MAGNERFQIGARLGLNVKAPSRLSRTLLGVLFFVCIIVVAAALVGFFTVRRSFPQTSGTIHLAGLKRPVTVYRDHFGIPQIYASNTHDLFFAQGFVHAQERFWQMDLWRHTGSGRLSEMLGDRVLDIDRFFRTLGFARLAKIELKQSDSESIAILNSYAAGVNAYLRDHHGSALSLEYTLLHLKNREYFPEHWQPIHSITWGKMMAWDLGENMSTEITRAILTKTLSHEQIDELFPPYPSDHPVILPGFGKKDAKTSSASLPPYSYALLKDTQQSVPKLDDFLGVTHEGIGSNNWVISGKRTATGKPVLCNDPHLGTQMPSIWYQVGLHCDPVSPECPVNVVGFSFAGVPGVIIGHNARVAWGFTNVGPDVMDLYIEKLNPQNPDQYEVNGKWVEMRIVDETIVVAGGVPVNLKVRYTRHGPIISDSYRPLKNFAQKTGLSFPAKYAIALRWTALDPTILFPAIWQMNIAQNWNDFREAASRFDVPSQNIIYADADGNIAYQVPGRIPIRKNGDGRYPVPGWTDDYEWTGFIPFEELPFAFNPPAGYVATANNAVTTTDYPYLLTTDWDYGFRAQRIVNLIENAKGPLTSADIQKIQGDDFNGAADAVLPALMHVSLNDAHLQSVREIFRNWDRQEPMDSSPAALFEVFWKHLLADTFHDDLPEDEWPSGGSRSAEVMRHLIDKPESLWWDNRKTSVRETRDDILKMAFAEAVAELEKRLGPNPGVWKWGDLHTVTYKNAVFGKTGISSIDRLFNRGPYPTAGGSVIVNATSWDATESYEVTSLPSMRMLVDFSDFDRSLTTNSPGQSGHAFHRHYNDLVDLWRNIQYYPMLWSPKQIQSNSEEVLHLEP